MFGVALENVESVFECSKTGVTADFADGAENADRTELFENVRIAQENAFERGRFARWKVGSDGFDDGRDFLRRKAEPLKQTRRFSDCVSNVVPLRERDRVFWTMADEDADVMEPRGGIKDVVFERLILCELFCEFVEARLMGKFVRGICLGADVVSDGVAVVDVWHEKSIRGSVKALKR